MIEIEFGKIKLCENFQKNLFKAIESMTCFFTF